MNESLVNGNWLGFYSNNITVVAAEGDKLKVEISGLPLFFGSSCSQTGNIATCQIKGWSIWKGTYNIKIKVTDNLGITSNKELPLYIK